MPRPYSNEKAVPSQMVAYNLLTQTQVLKLFGRKSRQTLYNWRRGKGFPTVVIPNNGGQILRFDADEVMRWAIKWGFEIKKPEVFQENYTRFERKNYCMALAQIVEEEKD